MKNVLNWCWVGLMAATVLVGCGREPARPNVVLVVIDTLRADHVGCYGYGRPTTPNIDALAKQAVVFRNAISQAPWTTPSIGSLLTSQYPSVLGISDKPARLHPAYALVSQMLKRHGYRTYGVINGPTVSASLGFGKGFDVFEEILDGVHNQVHSPEVTAKAIAMMGQAKQPFFLFVHNFDPHYNYIGHAAYDFDPDYTGSVISNEAIQSLWKRRHTLSEADVAHVAALHDSEVAYTDAHVGRLIEELKRRGLYDNTIIIVTADHGEEFMERGWIGHSVTVQQELIHVPLVIKAPGVPPRVVDDYVGLIDVVPTLLAQLGLPVPDGLEGQAIDLAGQRPIAARPVFSETLNNQPHFDAAAPTVERRSVIVAGRKLIVDAKANTTRLFDLATDPAERRDLAAEHKAEADRLGVQLQQWLRDVEQKRATTPAPDGHEFSPEEYKRLKDLGYVS